MSAGRIIFDKFCLDLANECLWQGSQAVKVRPKAFAVLTYLLGQPGRLVTKEELLNAVWPNTFVGDAVLKVTIRQLREALADDPKSPRFIETAHRRGYRFIGQLSDCAPQFALRDSPAGAGVVGRDETLARLRGWLERMLRGERQSVFVTGEAGIGKTALVDAFVRGLPLHRRVRVGRGQCLEQYGTGEAYLPVLEAIGRLCREDEQVAQVLRAHAPMWLLQMPSLLSASDHELLSREMSGATRERMLREMGEALEVLTAELPLVLVLEDLHWSDHSTVDLLSYLAQQREPAHLMIIGTYREAELIVSGHPLKAVKQELLAKQQCQELPLEYLSEAAVTSYLKERFSHNRFPGGLGRMIHERTEGNALFMVNVVDYLVTAQQIVERGDDWDLSVDLENVELGVPDNIKQMIEKQLDRLNPEQQQLLEAASVAGAEFSHLAVVAGLEDDRQTVETLFEELARHRHYIQDCGIHELPNGQVATRYGFVHALYRSVLYERLSPARLIQMHRAIAERGEEVYGERAKEIAGELAMHFERGRDHKRAAKYFQQAANNAIRRFAYREAVVLARRGIEMVERLSPGSERVTQELCLQLTLGVPLVATEGYASGDVGKVYSRARELAQQIGDTPDIAEVLWGLWTFHMLRAELETAREIAEEFLHLAARLPYPGLAMRGHWALEITFTHLGQFELALDHFQQALALYEPEQHREDSFLYALNPGVAMPCFAAWALWITGDSEESLQRIEEALSLARELSEPHGQAHAFFSASFLHHLRRDPAKTLEFADAVIAVSVEHGLLMYHAMATVMRGWALGEQQQDDEAIATMYGGLAALRVTGAHLVEPHFLALLAEALARAGQVADGLGLIDEAIETVSRNGERYCEAELYRVKGEILLLMESGAAAEAKNCFEESLRIARQQKATAWEQRTTGSLAKLALGKAHGK